MLEIDTLIVDYAGETGAHRAVKGISFAVRQGEFFTLLGPSGCGKTTTIRSVAGFEVPTGGRISIGGNPVFASEQGIYVPVNRREIAMVFQSYAIWPHMSVFENVVFPLDAEGMSRRGARARVLDALEMVGLAQLHDRSASQLSGGQQQRVALARAIVRNAKLLLLDEPLSNLDAKLRDQMRAELRALQERLGTTTIYVTHDQEEALSLSDRIALMRGGEIVELGPPAELYRRPKTLFTAEFIGQTNVLECAPAEARGAALTLKTDLGVLVVGQCPPSGAVSRVVVRPEHVRFVESGSDRPSGNIVEGIVDTVTFAGRLIEYSVHVGSVRLRVQALSDTVRSKGEPVTLHLPPDLCVALAT